MAKGGILLALGLVVLAVAITPGSTAGTRRLLIPGGRSVTVNGRTIYVNPSQVNATNCTDVAPDDQYTCEQQRFFGKCEAEFMRSGNYCARTCKRCGFKVNPPQNKSQCSDVSPDERYDCTQQRDFGKCGRPYIIKGHYCARTCGFPPCPPVANRTAVPAPNVTGPRAPRENITPGNATTPGVAVTTPPVAPLPKPELPPANVTARVTPAVENATQTPGAAANETNVGEGLRPGSSAGTRRRLIEGGHSVTVNGRTIYVNPSQVNATGCTDVAPDDQYTCEQQKSFGACKAEFMLSGNYCARTCDRCATSGATSGTSGLKVNPPQNKSQCSDVAPDERYNCTQQKSFGACEADFMLSGNYCAQTCERCGLKVNPPQDRSQCTDVAPDNHYNCTQQREFGKCGRPYIIKGHYCARTCGFPPCPPVANRTAVPAPNVTGPRAPRENITPGNATTPGVPPVVTTPPVGALPEPELPPANVTATVTPAVTNATEAPGAAGNAPNVGEGLVPGAPATPAVVTTPPLGSAVAPPAPETNLTEAPVATPTTGVTPAVTNATQTPGLAANETNVGEGLVPGAPSPSPVVTTPPLGSAVAPPAPETNLTEAPVTAPTPATPASPAPVTPVVVATPPVAAAPVPAAVSNVTAPAEAAASNVTAPAEAAASNVTAPAEAAASNVTAPAQAAVSNVTAPAQAAAANAAAPVAALPGAAVNATAPVAGAANAAVTNATGAAGTK